MKITITFEFKPKLAHSNAVELNCGLDLYGVSSIVD